MSWVRLDDSLAFHPKILDAGNEAVGVWARMLTWSAGAATDGRLTRAQAMAIAADPALLDRLVENRLLDVVGAGFQLHDFGDFNPTGAEATAARDRRKRAAKVAAAARWGRADASDIDALPHAATHPLPHALQCHDPDPDPLEDPDSRSGRAHIARARMGASGTAQTRAIVALQVALQNAWNNPPDGASKWPPGCTNGRSFAALAEEFTVEAESDGDATRFAGRLLHAGVALAVQGWPIPPRPQAWADEKWAPRLRLHLAGRESECEPPRARVGSKGVAPVPEGW